MDIFVDELTIDLVDGAEIRLKHWGKKGYPIVAIHGWMDNSVFKISFYSLVIF